MRMSELEQGKRPSTIVRLTAVAAAMCGLILLVFVTNATFIGCSEDDEDPTPTPTPTPTFTPTMTPTMTPTITPTPFFGWGDEEIAGPEGIWLDLDGNTKEELVVGYFLDGSMKYITRSETGTWSEPKLVDGTENNCEGNSSMPRAQIDDSGDLHFVYNEQRQYTDSCWTYIEYNRWQAASQTWTGHVTVIGNDISDRCTWKPDLAVNDNRPVRRYVVAYFYNSLGFNWDFGSGFKHYNDVDPYACFHNNYGELGPRSPRVAITPDGKAFVCFSENRAYGDSNQLGFAIFDPETTTFSPVEIPVPYSSPHYPGYLDIAADKDGGAHMVYFLWHPGVYIDQLWYVKREPAGGWGQPELVEEGYPLWDEEMQGYVQNPCVAVNEDGVIMVVFATFNSVEGKVYFSLKEPGQNWTVPEWITQSEGQGWPSLTVVGKKFFIVWKDARGQIYMNFYVP